MEIFNMKLDKPKNNNYCATVVKINNIIPLEGCDNVVGTAIFGFRAIVSKETKVGDIGILFPVETELSDVFCHMNNLYRHNGLNIDKKSKGYLEDNRRVRSVKFRGHVSNCLFMPLSSIEFAYNNYKELEVGNEFDTINGIEICKKFVLKSEKVRQNKQQISKKKSRVEAIHMPEHFDTDNFFKWSDRLDPNTDVIVTQKLHGTSVRIGHTIVKRKLSWLEKLVSKLGVRVHDTEYDYIYGSRKVIKDINNPDHIHYYDEDIWTSVGRSLIDKLPEGYVVYGEIIGYTGSKKEIQNGYSYNVMPGKAELYVYRIANVNHKGVITDLSWAQVKEFCNRMDIKHVPELWAGKLSKLPINKFVDKKYYKAGFKNALPLGDNNDLVDEGVCIRIDRIVPYIMKAKSPKFYDYETSLLDKNEVDLETSENTEQ